jgi:uncharacterized protein (DUF885 family)
MNEPSTSSIDALADAYVSRFAELDPVAATAEGITGHDEELTDYSPDGIAARAEHDRAALRTLEGLVPETHEQRVAARVMAERLRLSLDLHDADEPLRDLRVLGSSVQDVRMCFDLMPTATAADWHAIATRLAGVPAALAGIEAALRRGIERGVLAARRQALACAEQARTWGGQTSVTPFFVDLVERFRRSGLDEPALGAQLEAAATPAVAAYGRLADFLVDEYAPRAAPQDAVGADRYALWARVFNGIDLNLAETVEWGWEELYRIEADMERVAARILPGAGVDAVIEHLETDPDRAIQGEDAFRAWLQELLDTTVAELDGTHFDIPERVKRVEAMIAPPGGAAAMYYTGPSEDFSRPGRTWYPTLGRTVFPLWGEVSICYHEGVPGHHLQIGQVRHLADRLNRFQRTLAGTSGHAEGWALYAERLMGELGYLDDPAAELGMLRAQAMRAVRVVVDIGMHLELRIPAHERYHPGERWTPELALPFVISRSRFPTDFMSSEVDRYLGLPGQAISYKVGERVWLEARATARRQLGPAFDLKGFHRHALDLGPLGLDQLTAELDRWAGAAAAGA